MLRYIHRTLLRYRPWIRRRACSVPLFHTKSAEKGIIIRQSITTITPWAPLKIRYLKWLDHFKSNFSNTFNRYTRPDVLRFTSPSAKECWCDSVAGAIFSFEASSFCSEDCLEDWPLSAPRELSSGLSTPFNPNARRRLSDRSVKLGARGRWCPRARPPIQGISQRIIR